MAEGLLVVPLGPLEASRNCAHDHFADAVCQHYRYWVIWRCPTVRYLDYAKVRDVERSKAKELFGTTEAPTDLANKVCLTPCPRLVSAANVASR